MEFGTVTLVCFACAFVLVLGGALVVYMGSLVKSAYQIKIEIRSEVEEGQKRLEDEVEKKIRIVRRELVEEVEKVKAAMATDNQRKISEALAAFAQRLTECETVATKDRTAAGQLFESVRQDITTLDRRIRQLRHDNEQLEARLAPREPLSDADPKTVGALAGLPNMEPTAPAL